MGKGVEVFKIRTKKEVKVDDRCGGCHSAVACICSLV